LDEGVDGLTARFVTRPVGLCEHGIRPRRAAFALPGSRFGSERQSGEHVATMGEFQPPGIPFQTAEGRVRPGGETGHRLFDR